MVQNLQVAVRATRKRSQILAFADSDGRVTRRWLRALAAPLGEPGVGAATGYRWFIPVPPAFWALMRGVWDAVVAGTLRPGDNRFAWGGAMAIRKDTFLEARVAEYWKNTLSDDYALSAARFFSWMRRQLAITRVYNPRQWWPGLIAHVFYCGGMAASVIASVKGYRLAELGLAASAFGNTIEWRGYRYRV